MSIMECLNQDSLLQKKLLELKAIVGKEDFSSPAMDAVAGKIKRLGEKAELSVNLVSEIDNLTQQIEQIKKKPIDEKAETIFDKFKSAFRRIGVALGVISIINKNVIKKAEEGLKEIQKKSIICAFKKVCIYRDIIKEIKPILDGKSIEDLIDIEKLIVGKFKTNIEDLEEIKKQFFEIDAFDLLNAQPDSYMDQLFLYGRLCTEYGDLVGLKPDDTHYQGRSYQGKVFPRLIREIRKEFNRKHPDSLATLEKKHETSLAQFRKDLGLV